MPALRTLMLTLAVGFPVGLAGCGSSWFDSQTAAPLTAGDFSQPARSTGTDAPISSPQASQTPKLSELPTTAIAPKAPTTTRQVKAAAADSWPEQPAPDDLIDVSSFAGKPDAPDPAKRPVDAPITVDSVVGQINGRPVYASEILNPLHGRLVAISQQVKDPSRWRRDAARVVVAELGNRIEDELILSEARANLAPEIQQGLFRFLNNIQKDLVSSQQGSAVKADQELKANTGRGLYQEAQDKLDREIIGSEIRTKVLPKVNVSWKSVRQEYERREKEFNPPSTAKFRLIAAPTEDAETLSKLEQALNAGTPFNEVAAGPLNTFNRTQGGLVEATVEGTFAQSEFFTIPELNAVAQRLTPGTQAGPVPYSTVSGRKLTGWIRLDEIDTPKGIPLYDAQLKIQNELKNERFNTERRRYFDHLRERGNVSKIEDMAQRLMNIAIERYQPDATTATPSLRPTAGDPAERRGTKPEPSLFDEPSK